MDGSSEEEDNDKEHCGAGLDDGGIRAEEDEATVAGTKVDNTSDVGK